MRRINENIVLVLVGCQLATTVLCHAARHYMQAIPT